MHTSTHTYDVSMCACYGMLMERRCIALLYACAASRWVGANVQTHGRPIEVMAPDTITRSAFARGTTTREKDMKTEAREGEEKEGL